MKLIEYFVKLNTHIKNKQKHVIFNYNSVWH